MNTTDVNEDICPNNDYGTHKYFIFKTLDAYVPTDWSKTQGALIGVVPSNMYEKKEYALLGCNCGSVIKQEVKQP